MEDRKMATGSRRSDPAPEVPTRAARVHTEDALARPLAASPQEWRCDDCELLLGIVRSRRLHIRAARGFEYLVSLPVTTTCRACCALNEIAPGGGDSP